MKVSKLVLAQVGLVWSKTDVHFNHDHPSSELAKLEKWNMLAHKFDRLHAEDFRPKFYQKWFGKNGRLDRENWKLEDAFARKCSLKHLDPNVTVEKEKTKRKRRSTGVDRHHNPGARIMHILNNMSKWAETYLQKCRNSDNVLRRYDRFMAKFEQQLMKNPNFQKEFDDDGVARTNQRGDRACGRIYNEFGLHGKSRQLYDDHEIGHLRDTDFGNDNVMSMAPMPGCWLRAYQHDNKEGYSAVCDNPAGCDLNVSTVVGALIENQATSVECHCNIPKPKICGAIFEHDGTDAQVNDAMVNSNYNGYLKAHPAQWTTLWENAVLGNDFDLRSFSKHDISMEPLGNDELSLIVINPGCRFDIWSDYNKGGHHEWYEAPANQARYIHGSTGGFGSVGNDAASTITCRCNIWDNI